MSVFKNLSEKAGQRGSLVLGIIIGLLLGLALALGVALYIAKVPVPFVDKVPHRTPEQDAAEAERNKNWDPNAPLAGKQTPPAPLAPAASAADAVADGARPVDAAASAAAAAERRAAAKAEAAAKAASDAAAKSTRDPAAILAGQMPANAPAAKASGPAKPGAEPFVYFVQAGAFSSAEDAEQQRAKLAILGLGTKVTEREQGGRTVYRVRLGPFDAREEAEAQQDHLKGLGTDAALVRVDRPH